MSVMFASIEPGGLRPVGERDVRRQLDLAIARAIVDVGYSRQLLADPTIALDGHGCTPQQYLQLREIQADSIREFACQAESLFWPTRQPLSARARAMGQTGGRVGNGG
jgi:hypothetical protein